MEIRPKQNCSKYMGPRQANDLVFIQNVSFESMFNIYLMVLKETQVKHVLLLFFPSKEES